MQSINDVIALIPENSHDEALFAIETITTFPAANNARVRVYPTYEFRLELSLDHGRIDIAAENRPTVSCSADTFLGKLKNVIYTIDEAISNGAYAQSRPKECLILDEPTPPADMDLPVWDEARGQWRDAEY